MISIKKRIPAIFIVSVILTFFVSSPIFCEETIHSSPGTANEHVADNHSSDTESHGEGHSADKSADLKDLAYRYLNFILLVIILVMLH